MVVFIQHVKIALVISAVALGGLLASNLVDLDHIGLNKLSPQAAAKCASYTDIKTLQKDPSCACPSGSDFSKSNCRGVFHSIWFLLFLIFLTVGVALHLYLDDVYG